MVKCPIHADGTASLSIARGATTSLVMRCHAGCATRDIMRAIDLTSTPAEMSESPSPQVVAEYTYHDARGATVAVKRRLLPKSFSWMAYDPTERRMRAGLPAGGQSNIPLYNLPALAALTPGERTVFVVEGEKDVETLRDAGMVATCNPEGASKAGSAYTPERWDVLRGHAVVILPDNDEPGKQHALRVADVLRRIAREVRVVDLPGLGEKQDVSDFLALHGTDAQAQLHAAVLAVPPLNDAPVLTVDRSRPRPLSLEDWRAEAVAMTEPIRVIPTPFPTLNDYCRRGGGRQGWRLGWHIVLAGAPGYGKTTVALNCAVYAALSGKKVGVVSLEMGRDEIMAIMLSIATKTHEKLLEAVPGVLNETFVQQAERFQAMLAERGGAVYLVDLPRSDIVTVERAIDQMIDDGCEMIVTDYMQRITVAGKPDDYSRLTAISNMLQEKAKQRQIVSLALSQFSRGTSGGFAAPKAQGMKGSSAIEDDAVQVLLIDHTSYNKFDDWDGKGAGAVFMLTLDKNRKGPGGSHVKIKLWMSHATLAVEEVA